MREIIKDGVELLLAAVFVIEAIAAKSAEQTFFEVEVFIEDIALAVASHHALIG